ncbi:MAG: hypothetical protein ACLQGP_40010 [Isosphaeraceae bacterium]
MVALAEEVPRDPVAVAALLWVANLGLSSVNPPERPGGRAYARALVILAQDHSDEPQIERLVKEAEMTPAIKYYLGKKDHHKHLTTENTERHGRRKVDSNSLFRVFPCFPWLISDLLRAVASGYDTELVEAFVRILVARVIGQALLQATRQRSVIPLARNDADACV